MSRITGQAPRELEIRLFKTVQPSTFTAGNTLVEAVRREQMAQTTCSRCSARYNSERELRDHLGTAHRKFGQEQTSSEPNNTKLELSADIVRNVRYSVRAQQVDATPSNQLIR
jgi:methyl coenzyme M reductase gamma subunit